MGGGFGTRGSAAALLRSVSVYPIPQEALEGLAARRGLDLARAVADPRGDRAFRLTLADLYVWLSRAPDVSQGGQHFSFGEETRRGLRAAARRIYAALGEAPADADGGAAYGYRGDRL